MKHIANIGKLLSIAACFAAVSSANAATLMQTNFNSLATGAVTDANLNSVTTGGVWTLDTARVGATYTIEGPNGDRALLADDTDNNNNGVQIFTTVVLNNVANFSVDAVTWNFDTAARRTAANRGVRYEFFSGATSVASLVWSNSGTLNLTGTNTASGTSGQTVLFAWDETASEVRDFTAVFQGTALNLTFGGQSLSVNLGGSSIDRMSVYSSASDTGNRGVYLDNMLVTQIPEPSAALLGGIGVLMLLRRRRCA
ncbi:MAG: hypothetical protein V4727_12290 [Verrucomicrobiota bacterium]